MSTFQSGQDDKSAYKWESENELLKNQFKKLTENYEKFKEDEQAIKNDIQNKERIIDKLNSDIDSRKKAIEKGEVLPNLDESNVPPPPNLDIPAAPDEPINFRSKSEEVRKGSERSLQDQIRAQKLKKLDLPAQQPIKRSTSDSGLSKLLGGAMARKMPGVDDLETIMRVLKDNNNELYKPLFNKLKNDEKLFQDIKDTGVFENDWEAEDNMKKLPKDKINKLSELYKQAQSTLQSQTEIDQKASLERQSSQPKEEKEQEKRLPESPKGEAKRDVEDKEKIALNELLARANINLELPEKMIQEAINQPVNIDNLKREIVDAEKRIRDLDKSKFDIAKKQNDLLARAKKIAGVGAAQALKDKLFAIKGRVQSEDDNVEEKEAKEKVEQAVSDQSEGIDRVLLRIPEDERKGFLTEQQNLLLDNIKWITNSRNEVYRLSQLEKALQESLNQSIKGLEKNREEADKEYRDFAAKKAQEPAKEPSVGVPDAPPMAGEEAALPKTPRASEIPIAPGFPHEVPVEPVASMPPVESKTPVEAQTPKALETKTPRAKEEKAFEFPSTVSETKPSEMAKPPEELALPSAIPEAPEGAPDLTTSKKPIKLEAPVSPKAEKPVIGEQPPILEKKEEKPVVAEKPVIPEKPVKVEKPIKIEEKQEKEDRAGTLPSFSSGRDKTREERGKIPEEKEYKSKEELGQPQRKKFIKQFNDIIVQDSIQISKEYATKRKAMTSWFKKGTRSDEVKFLEETANLLKENTPINENTNLTVFRDGVLAYLGALQLIQWKLSTESRFFDFQSTLAKMVQEKINTCIDTLKQMEKYTPDSPVLEGHLETVAYQKLYALKQSKNNLDKALTSSIWREKSNKVWPPIKDRDVATFDIHKIRETKKSKRQPGE